MARAAVPAILLAAAWATSAGGALAAADADVQAAWNGAYVGLPAELTGEAPVLGNWRNRNVQEAVQKVAAGTRVPAVIFLHGCTGFGAEGDAYRLLLSLHGFAFFAPDSLARPERVRNCDPVSRETGINGNAAPLRLVEIDDALAQLRRLPWIDPDRLYLVGFSEGAAVAAQFSGAAFAGVVLAAWHCHGSDGNRGIALPASVPVLSLIGRNDPWYPVRDERTCALFMADRPASRAIVLDQNSHSILTSDSNSAAREARTALLAFLNGKSGGRAVDR